MNEKLLPCAIIGAIASAMVALFFLLSITSCTTFGSKDVRVEWVSEDGRTFQVSQTEDGIDIVGEFVEPNTGLKFVLGEGVGNFTIRDPKTGVQVSVQPKE